MNLTERAILIKSIAACLANETGESINATLFLFKIGYGNYHDYSDYDTYARFMLGDTDDEKLLALKDYFQIDIKNDVRPEVVLPNFWLPNHFRLFLSHKSTYKTQTQNLSLALKKYKISAFVAHEDIEPSLEWQQELKSALRTMEALVTLITPDFHESHWTDQEVGFALGRNILVLPIDMGVTPYGFMGERQALKGQGKDINTLTKDIVAILSKHELTNRKMSQILVDLFETSPNFDKSKEIMSLLEKMDTVDYELLSRINNALKSNFQISKAFGIPERVNTFLKKHKFEARISSMSDDIPF